MKQIIVVSGEPSKYVGFVDGVYIDRTMKSHIAIVGIIGKQDIVLKTYDSVEPAESVMAYISDAILNPTILPVIIDFRDKPAKNKAGGGTVVDSEHGAIQSTPTKGSLSGQR